MKSFSKNELIGLAVVFLLLVVISVPNFILSIRRARDQVRRDDIGTIDAGLGQYFSDFGQYPPATKDGKVLACIKLGDKVTKDKNGQLIANIIPCEWGKSVLADLTPGSTKRYLDSIPADPSYLNGPQYLYLSDGDRYQIFASFEDPNEAGYDTRIVARHLMCGNSVCNFGRFFGCPPEKSISQCEFEDAQRK